MKTVAFYYDEKVRSRALSTAVVDGFKNNGIHPSLIYHHGFHEPDHDVAIFYGLHGRLDEIRKAYTAAGKHAVLLDLGYWGREEGGRLNGYHRIAVNGLHGSPYFGRIGIRGARYKKFNFGIQQFDSSSNRGRPILLQGQSAKAAKIYGYAPEEWERKTIEEIRRYTDRPIIYIPKHTWDGKKPIEGAQYFPGEVPQKLTGAWAVVSHHSNASIKALEKGVPIFTDDGVAKCFSRPLSDIENPYRPAGKEVLDFMERVANLQWSVFEMRRGIFQKFLMEHLCAS